MDRKSMEKVIILKIAIIRQFFLVNHAGVNTKYNYRSRCDMCAVSVVVPRKN